MTKRKFTPPTEFPAEYVDGSGDKAVILGRGPNENFPFIGYDADEDAVTWTENGEGFPEEGGLFDLHDIPEVTAGLEQAEARIEELEAKLAKAESQKYHVAWLEVEIVELEAKLAEAERSLDISCAIIDGLMEDKDDE